MSVFKKNKDHLRQYKVLGISLIQWLILMMIVGSGLLLLLQHWFS